MSDGNATERICEQLEAAGVSFVRNEQIIAGTYWGVTWLIGDTKFEFRENDERTDMIVFNATPEQAVAATLGRGECHITASSTDGLCSDAPRKWFRLSCGHSFTVDGLGRPVACPACGKAVS